MTASLNISISTTVEEIKKIDEMIGKLKEGLPDPVVEFSIQQFEDVKKDMVKQIFIALVDSPLSVSDLEPFIQHATAYLKKSDRGGKLPAELKSTLADVEKMMA